MPDRIPHSNQDIITGQQATTNYLRMQKMLGKFYLRKFFAILDGQHKTGRFLEIGSGTGYQTAGVAEKSPQAEIVAVEPSADMIAVATGYLAQRGLDDRVQFVQGSVEDEALIRSLGEFDLIYSTFSLHHWLDPVQAFRNLYGALKPAGVLLIYDFQRDWLACWLPLSKGMVESIRAAYTPDEIKGMVAQAGKSQCSIRSSFPYLSILITRPDEHLISQARNSIKPLPALQRGQAGWIISIQPDVPERMQELLAMGISPYATVKMIANYAHYMIFMVDRREFAADRETTAGILLTVLS
jgi:ubiquinone/menaquinone biosynthesis C-methylase UbiE/Fe2+ transport system protein FeoA